ncbi:hypothetical protein CISIN_1g045057mg [Citrus sinensis]|uniref:14-3-3 domain-containing protein n=1 Tax=Citrus sinensis TaxID=2711 RepID=A0A067DTL3_CITSI|nr:hypothetical protein CISIN_1g045057mg [Citrus sinensis]
MGIYSEFITVMGKKGQTRMAMRHFSEMRNSRFRPDASPLLHEADKNVIGARRASWRIMSSIKQKEELRGNQDYVSVIKEYRSKIKAELTEICGGILKLLDQKLVPATAAAYSKVFYLKMKGDYHRYFIITVLHFSVFTGVQTAVAKRTPILASSSEAEEEDSNCINSFNKFTDENLKILSDALERKAPALLKFSQVSSSRYVGSDLPHHMQQPASLSTPHAVSALISLTQQ